MRDRLWEAAEEKGNYITTRVLELVDKYPQVYKSVTGKGLLIGQHFQSPELGGQVAAEMFRRGVVVSGTLTSAQTIRIEPPLVITYDEINQGLGSLAEAVEVVAKTL